MNVAVITGASMGLGEEFARQLAQRRVSQVLVARSEDRLKALAEDLQQRHGIRAYPFACDLAQPGAARKVAAFLKEKDLHPTWLVNNAGFGLVGTFDQMDHDRVHDMMMLNVLSLVELTHLLLPSIRLSRDGRVINVASTAAFQPVPFFNVYAASKTFVLNFSEALHEELRGTDVKVLALCPGPTPTGFGDAAGIDEKFFNKGQSAADVVRMGLEANDRNRAVLICQRRLAVIAQRFMPRAAIRFGAGLIARRMLRLANKE
jgi:short-subunit dehydrogenase